jgi:FtsZ-binding cell division protein ZapB
VYVRTGRDSTADLNFVGVEELKDKRDDLTSQIKREEEERNGLEKEIEHLSNKLQKVKDSLERK